MSRKRKSKKRVQAGKKSAKTRSLNMEYGRYLASEKERRETPYKFHAKRVARVTKKTGKGLLNFAKHYKGFQ